MIYTFPFNLQNRKHLSYVIEILFPAIFFCFFSLVAYSFKKKEKKPRKFSVCVAFTIIQKDISALLLFYLSFVRMSVKKPIYFIIGQSAVNASTYNQPTIL